MYHDGEACKQADTMCIVWARQLDRHIGQYADELAAEYHVKAAETSYHSAGAFNRCYQMTIKERLKALLRFPILGKVAFRKEKVMDEVLVMKYIAKHTQIPLPRLIRVSDSSWGPCVAMEFVDGDLLSDRLKAPGEAGNLHVLNPNVDPQT